MAGTGFTEAEKRSRPPEEDATTKPPLNADAAPHGAIATDDKKFDDAESGDGLESLEDIEELEDIDGGEDDLDDDDALVDTLDDEDSLDDSLDDDALGADAEDLGAVAVVVDGAARAAAPADASPEAETDDDELLTDEVEASLDVILAERLRGGDNEADDEVEADDEEDDLPNQLATVIPVRRPEEFLCQSCFLLKPPGQLADRDHQLCRDCA